MATNGILDITTEEYMGQDPEMQIDQDEMIDIIKTLQIVGVPQDKHPEILEAFKEWKQTKNGTVDMFLEESFQLEPGTITKIKEQSQVAQGPQDMQSEEEMSIPAGSDDMREIMQSVGAPQRAAEGGRAGFERGGNAFWDDKSWENFDRYNDETETGKAYLDETDAILDKFAERFPNMETDNMRIQDILALLQAEGIMGVEGLGLSGLDQSLDMITPESLDRSVQRISRGDTQYGDVPEEIFNRAEGGRAGYAEGDVILPQPRYGQQSDESMRGMMEANQNDPRYSAMGMKTDSSQIYPERRPEMPYMAEQQMQPFTGGVASVMPAGLSPFTGQEGSFGQANEMGVQGMENVDMRVVMDFLMKMGMEPTPENIEEAIEALGAAAQYGQEEEAMDMRHGGRAQYGLGDLVRKIVSAPKKIFKSAKKILKTPLGKAAALYVTYKLGPKMFGKDTAVGGEGGWGDVWHAAKQKASSLPFIGPKDATLPDPKWANLVKDNAQRNMEKFGVPNGGKYADFMFNKSKDIYEGVGTKVAEKAPWYKDPWKMIPLMSMGAGAYTAANPGETSLDGLGGERKEEVAEWDEWLAQIGKNPELYNFGKKTTMPYPDYAQGGRIGRQEGGIMDLDGMEKDFRNTGGFVDLGAKEKADDVPARLSVNEFVMTADAVRGAGDGDVDQGAERLQQTMKQLEQKGKRHKAAQGMFATSQRLGEVL